MTFEEKRDAVDLARAESIELDNRFKDLLGSGLSSVGAYNAIHAEIQASKPAPKSEKPVTAPKPTATTKVSKANEQPSKSK
jgi:hypothetical protein